MGRRSHLCFLEGVGGGVVRYRGQVIKQKSPDFRSPEVGISVETFLRLGYEPVFVQKQISHLFFLKCL